MHGQRNIKKIITGILREELRTFMITTMNTNVYYDNIFLNSS